MRPKVTATSLYLISVYRGSYRNTLGFFLFVLGIWGVSCFYLLAWLCQALTAHEIFPCACGLSPMPGLLSSFGPGLSRPQAWRILAPDQGWNRISGVGKWILNHQATRDVPGTLLILDRRRNWYKSVVLNWGQSSSERTFGNIWRHLSWSQFGWRMFLMASSRSKPGIPGHILHEQDSLPKVSEPKCQQCCHWDALVET